MNAVTLQYLAERVGGTIQGNPAILCHQALPLCDATAGQITLLDDAKSLPKALASDVAAIVVRQAISSPIPQLIVPHPHEAFASIVSYFRPQRVLTGSGIHPSAKIDPTARIGQGSVIHPQVIIGAEVTIGNQCVIMPGVVILDGSRLGNDITLFPNVVIYAETVIEDRVMIHANSVIGAFGFGYHSVDGRHERSPQLGYVHIEADVELGACTTIDRGTFGATRIGAGTKMDNHVMIGHNCHIGRHNLICSQAGIAGSSSTGDYCVLAGQVGLADHVHIGDRVTVGAQAGVMSQLPSGGTYLGSPAMPIREQMLIYAILRKLPGINRTIRKLEQMWSREEPNESPQRRDAA